MKFWFELWMLMEYVLKRNLRGRHYFFKFSTYLSFEFFLIDYYVKLCVLYLVIATHFPMYKQPDTNLQHILNNFNIWSCLNQPIKSAYSERSRLACSLYRFLNSYWTEREWVMDKWKFQHILGQFRYLRTTVLRHLHM